MAQRKPIDAAAIPSVEWSDGLPELLDEVRRCTYCRDLLPYPPRPVVRASATARLLIISQAPGTRVHETGISFNDRSGDRLRDWLQLDRDQFYDTSRVAILGMGFCYPGVDRKGGDRPPTRPCAPRWHPALLARMPEVALTLPVGSYAMRRYLGLGAGGSATAILRGWRSYLPTYLPLPHPSWRNTGWLRANPWFEAEVLPELRVRVATIRTG
jgi:uracil-DNA glycosylase